MRGLVEVAVEHPRTASELHGPKRCWSSGGHAEQLADHGDREREADRLDEVEARRVGLVEHPVDQLGDVRAQLLHRARA